jgi:hypothetical protein
MLYVGLDLSRKKVAFIPNGCLQTTAHPCGAKIMYGTTKAGPEAASGAAMHRTVGQASDEPPALARRGRSVERRGPRQR